MSVYTKYQDRVNHAARAIVNNGPFNRTFDTCFEMNDGDKVCAALVRRAAKNQKLLEALRNSQGLDFQHMQKFFGLT